MKRSTVFIVLACGILFSATVFADSHMEVDVDPGLNAALRAFERNDIKKALRLLVPIAKRGEAEAQYILARIHTLGLSVKKDLKKAEEWYRKAAKQGHPRAQTKLAILLRSKEGIHDQEALALLRKAAKGGYPPAQYTLSRKYRWGDGVEPSDGMTLYWLRKAAYQGYAYARMDLGENYFFGARGMKKNLVLSLMWTILATRSGHPGGKSWGESVSEKMTRKQIDEAKRLAGLW